LSTDDALAVVVVTYDSADSITELLSDLLAQLRPGDELVVIDNASSDQTAEIARRSGQAVHVIRNEHNLGFGGACHSGARATQAPLLLFINPDCRLQPHCLDRLRSAAADRPAWGAWQAAVLLPDGRINTDGGVVHFIGIGWAGDCGKPADVLPPSPTEVAFPSGAAMVIRRSVWDELGGFDESYFLYSEDLDLGLRLWLSGHRVGVVPGARVVHAYEFNKGTAKWFWLERNRWRTVLSVYPLSLLLLLTPALLAAELALLFTSARDGWLASKLRAEADVAVAIPRILRRRRAVQATRKVSVRSFGYCLTASLDSAYLSIGEHRWAVLLQMTYWSLVQRFLARLDQ
jgi:GT2 family glycosyltransferase